MHFNYKTIKIIYRIYLVYKRQGTRSFVRIGEASGHASHAEHD